MRCKSPAGCRVPSRPPAAPGKLHINVSSTRNVLRLEIYVDDWSRRVVRVIVDDVDLAELAQAVEQPFAVAEGHPANAGSYGGLPVEDVARPSRRFWGHDPFYGETRGKVALLGCGGCGEEGCWPLAVRVALSADIVMWSDFEQPHRPQWNLSTLGPFVFARAQYEAAIAVLGNDGHL